MAVSYDTFVGVLVLLLAVFVACGVVAAYLIYTGKETEYKRVSPSPSPHDSPHPVQPGIPWYTLQPVLPPIAPYGPYPANFTLPSWDSTTGFVVKKGTQPIPGKEQFGFPDTPPEAPAEWIYNWSFSRAIGWRANSGDPVGMWVEWMPIFTEYQGFGYPQDERPQFIGLTSNGPHGIITNDAWSTKRTITAGGNRHVTSAGGFLPSHDNASMDVMVVMALENIPTLWVGDTLPKTSGYGMFLYIYRRTTKNDSWEYFWPDPINKKFANYFGPAYAIFKAKPGLGNIPIPVPQSVSGGFMQPDANTMVFVTSMVKLNFDQVILLVSLTENPSMQEVNLGYPNHIFGLACSDTRVFVLRGSTWKKPTEIAEYAYDDLLQGKTTPVSTIGYYGSGLYPVPDFFYWDTGSPILPPLPATKQPFIYHPIPMAVSRDGLHLVVQNEWNLDFLERTVDTDPFLPENRSSVYFKDFDPTQEPAMYDLNGVQISNDGTLVMAYLNPFLDNDNQTLKLLFYRADQTPGLALSQRWMLDASNPFHVDVAPKRKYAWYQSLGFQLIRSHGMATVVVDSDLGLMQYEWVLTP